MVGDNFCLYFGHIRRPRFRGLARRKIGRQVGDCSAEVTHQELQGRWVQVALPLEKREIIEASAVIDAFYGNDQGYLAAVITIDGVP